MSHIAAALAKSKGKNVPPPTENITGVPGLRIGPAASPILKPVGPAPKRPEPAPLLAYNPAPPPVTPAPPKRMLLIGIVALFLVAAGISAWLLLRNGGVFTSAVPPVPTSPAAAPRTTTPPAETAPVRKGPSDALAEKVRLLPITAAAGGGSQRLSVGRKVYEPGETVVDGLILQSIENEEIVFRDTEGNLYTRRL